MAVKSPKLIIATEDAQEEMVSYSFGDTTRQMHLRSAAMHVVLEVPDVRIAGDCSQSHTWSMWKSYVSEYTSYRDGMWHTTKTPHQRRVCVACGYEVDRRI